MRCLHTGLAMRVSSFAVIVAIGAALAPAAGGEERRRSPAVAAASGEPGARIAARKSLPATRRAQRPVEAPTHRGRTAAEYDALLRSEPALAWPSDRRPSAGDVLLDYLGLDPNQVTGADRRAALSYAALLRRMHELRGRPIRWADLAGGLGVAQRELHRAGALAEGQLETTNVDLVDWTRARSTGDGKRARSRRDLFDPRHAPRLVVADPTTVRLEERQDLVSLTDAIVDVDDKLAAIANAYNQAVDDGVVIISADRRWAEYIVEDTPQGDRPHVFERFADALTQAGIQIGGRGDLPSISRAKTLVLIKRAGTSLRVDRKLVGTRVGLDGATHSVYATSDAPPVTVRTDRR